MKYVFIGLWFGFFVSTINVNASLYVNQIGYETTLSDTNVNLTYSNTVSIKAFVTLDGSPITGVYFNLIGTQYDIDENQFDLLNGTYLIIFSKNNTKNIAPGNYNVFLSGLHQENEFSTPFQIVITSSDLTSPLLNIISPELSQNFNLSIFKLTLSLEDETAWYDLNITAGGTNLFYLSRREVGSELPDLTYNVTYLFLSVWIDLREITNLKNSNFEIIARDSSFNIVNALNVMEGDYVSPKIMWISHINEEKISFRELTLKWEIVDVSPMQSQILLLNGQSFLEVPLGPELREIEIFIPIPPDESSIIEITLIVEDVFGNNNQSLLVLIYNFPQESELFFNIRENINEILVLFGVIIGIVIIIVTILYWRNKSEGSKIVKIPKKLRKIIDERPEIIEEDNMEIHAKFLYMIDILEKSSTRNELKQSVMIAQSEIDFIQFEIGENLNLHLLRNWIEKIHLKME